MKNLSPLPYSSCFDFHPGASLENLQELQMGNIRGISVAATRSYARRASIIRGNRIHNLKSKDGRWIIGIDCQGDTRGVEIMENEGNLKQGESMSEKYLALRIGLASMVPAWSYRLIMCFASWFRICHLLDFSVVPRRFHPTKLPRVLIRDIAPLLELWGSRRKWRDGRCTVSWNSD